MDTPEQTKEKLKEQIEYLKRVHHKTFEQIAEKLNISEEEVKEIWSTRKQNLQKSNQRKMLNQRPVTLQYDIVARFLKGSELEKFWEQYKSNTKTIGGLKREVVLKQPISAEDLEVLKIYVTQFELPLKDVAIERNIPLGSLYTRVSRTAARIVTQYPQILDQVVTQG